PKVGNGVLSALWSEDRIIKPPRIRGYRARDLWYLIQGIISGVSIRIKKTALKKLNAKKSGDNAPVGISPSPIFFDFSCWHCMESDDGLKGMMVSLKVLGLLLLPSTTGGVSY
ncbi:MAG: hypothetical protein Q7T80_16925, partial [Methanoregula sp.]|nr:hypothetical protein [Methanoregula sp.]